MFSPVVFAAVYLTWHDITGGGWVFWLALAWGVVFYVALACTLAALLSCSESKRGKRGGEPGSESCCSLPRRSALRRSSRRSSSRGVGTMSGVRRDGRSGAVGYGATWRRTRNAYIREHIACERCGAPAREVHHRDHRGPRGPRGLDWRNLEALWLKAQKQVARLSTASILVRADLSGHGISMDQPNLTGEAIREVIAAVRIGRALPACTETPLPRFHATCLDPNSP